MTYTDDNTTGDTTGYYQIIYICPYEGQCTDSGVKCGSCRHGKRSFYEPVPYVPYPTTPYPWTPPYYTTPWIFYDNTSKWGE